MTTAKNTKNFLHPYISLFYIVSFNKNNNIQCKEYCKICVRSCKEFQVSKPLV